jgi:hypothetical protein
VPFQQLINITSSLYGNYINAGWSNVAFTEQVPNSINVTFLQAWVESGASNTSNSTMVWVKLLKSIPPLSSTTIYMDFAATNVMSTNGPTGEASQLSSVYGKYDNIGKVMNQGLIFQIYNSDGNYYCFPSFEQPAYAASMLNNINILNDGCNGKFFSYQDPLPINIVGFPVSLPAGSSTSNALIAPYGQLTYTSGDEGYILKAIGFIQMPDSSTTLAHTTNAEDLL